VCHGRRRGGAGEGFGTARKVWSTDVPRRSEVRNHLGDEKYVGQGIHSGYGGWVGPLVGICGRVRNVAVTKILRFWQKRSPNCNSMGLPPYPLLRIYDGWVRRVVCGELKLGEKGFSNYSIFIV
jgi:hypothetical protein